MNTDNNTATVDSNVNTDDASTQVSTQNVDANNGVTPSNDSNTTGASQTTQPPKTNGVQQGSQVRHNNAVRRIQETNKQLRSKVGELEKQIRQLQKSNKPEDVAKVDRLLDQHETYSNIVSNGEREAWEQEAVSVFGDEAPIFLELTDKYADYINANEPQLLDYMGTTYGLILMAEWVKRMEVPQYRLEWQGFPSYKKAQVLGRFYEEIEKLAKNNGGTTTTATNNNVPAVSGGRHTNGQASPDDLSGQISQAFKEFGFENR